MHKELEAALKQLGYMVLRGDPRYEDEFILHCQYRSWQVLIIYLPTRTFAGETVTVLRPWKYQICQLGYCTNNNFGTVEELLTAVWLKVPTPNSVVELEDVIEEIHGSTWDAIRRTVAMIAISKRSD